MAAVGPLKLRSPFLSPGWLSECRAVRQFLTIFSCTSFLYIIYIYIVLIFLDRSRRCSSPVDPRMVLGPSTFSVVRVFNLPLENIGKRLRRVLLKEGLQSKTAKLPAKLPAEGPA